MNTRQLVIAVTGHSAARDDTRIYSDQTLRVDLPVEFSDKHLAQMRGDLTRLAELIDSQPEALMEIQSAVLRNDLATASRRASEIGLTEADMKANGGGMWGYILVAAVIIGAYAAFGGATEEETPPPPPPPPPPPVDGGTG